MMTKNDILDFLRQNEKEDEEKNDRILFVK